MATKIATNTLTNSAGSILLNSTKGNLPVRFYSIRALPVSSIHIRFSRRRSLISDGDSLNFNSRSWSRSRSGIVNGGFSVVDDVDDDDEDDEEEDRSLDLLVRFVQNMFRKISKKARKAVRSVLPVPISSQLVGFSVNGVIILTFMWVLKAFLEVICTLGSVIFVSILLVRGIWTGISYLQEYRNHRIDELDDEHRAWRGSQPAT
ncbi:OLC1v1002860C1 [Oldenlandia corymbosa var. corymbosa]|uniref:OLC1v1002860C1 n=1 Tax=Oldenlandia corymbosa var. corymbosa TaxID=529605 RepID=A0AAV1DB51_OLDCO|nr:OLC1v1002860C1 [Oldenlandia corymbosa var. corymbosa]